MGDSTYIKLYVCVHNKWNYSSKEIKKLSEHQWIMEYLLINLRRYSDWEDFYKNNSELTASITMPENYKQYSEYQEKILKKKGEAIDTKIGKTHHAVANSHFDPRKGLVDSEGNLLIPKNRFENMLDMEGIAISY